jgi:hypothetical protein
MHITEFITQIFSSKPKPAFFYSVVFVDAHNCAEVFSKTSDVFLCGIGIICGHSATGINRHNITPEVLDTLSDHLNSIGISVHYTQYDSQKLDRLYRNILTDVCQLSSTIPISIKVNGRTNEATSLELESQHYDVQKIHTYIQKTYAESKFLLDFLPKNELKDYHLKLFFSGKRHWIWFDFLKAP